MINYIQHKNIDKEKWDSCIEKSPNSCVFVYSWYLDIACENWTALVLNDYQAVFPLASKSKFNTSYLYQPFFTRYFGVFSVSGSTNNLTTDFLKAIPQKYKYIEYCLKEPNDNNVYSENSFPLLGFLQTQRKFQFLELITPYENIYKNYSVNTKRNIKKALNAGFEIKFNVAPALIVNLFKSTKGKELEIFKTKDYERLQLLMNTLVNKNKAESIAVYDEKGCLSAAAFFMHSKNCFVYLKSGVTEYGKSNGAMHLVLDIFIRKYAATNQILDFGGSSVETVARFYKNFGAKDCVYLQLKKNTLSPFAKWLSKKR